MESVFASEQWGVSRDPHLHRLVLDDIDHLVHERKQPLTRAAADSAVVDLVHRLDALLIPGEVAPGHALLVDKSSIVPFSWFKKMFAMMK